MNDSFNCTGVLTRWLKEIFLIGFSQKDCLRFRLKPVNSNKKYPHAKASGNSFRQLFFNINFTKGFALILPNLKFYYGNLFLHYIKNIYEINTVRRCG